MAIILNKNNIRDIRDAAGVSYIKMYDINGNTLWEKGGSSSDWQLVEDSYIIGADGKYYEKWIDWSRAVDNNPIPDLNNQWVEDSITTDKDSNFDYYMSDNMNMEGMGQGNQMCIKWKGLSQFTIKYKYTLMDDFEADWQYMVINGLDMPKFDDFMRPQSYTEGILAHTQGLPSEWRDLEIDCDMGEHFIWVWAMKGWEVEFTGLIAIPNIYASYPEGSIKEGDELRYEWIKTEFIEVTREGYGNYICYKHYYTPDGKKDILTDEYEVREMPLTPIQRDYLRFDATDGDLHIGVNDLSLFTNLEYNIAGFDETWATFTNDGVDVPNGSCVYLRGTGTSSNNTARTFTTSVPCECHGDIMSLLYGRSQNTYFGNTIDSYRFHSLFANTKIKTAPRLNALYCYSYGCYYLFDGCSMLADVSDVKIAGCNNYSHYCMFQNCTSLVSVPDDMFAQNTYTVEQSFGYMFNGCTSLTKAPKLYATYLRKYCYYYMFKNCTSLVSVPENMLTASLSTDAVGCYTAMFYGCTSLTNVPRLPATTLRESCYNAMFWGCTSLTTIPEGLLPATKATSYCYAEMFKNCTSLVSVPENLLPATNILNQCYQSMFEGCTSLTNVPKLPATSFTNAKFCYSKMFKNCKSLTSVPENLLPAVSIYAEGCYQSMFEDCTSLTNAPILPATVIKSYCYERMFLCCTNLTSITIYVNNFASLYSLHYMFLCCTNLTSITILAENWNTSAANDWLSGVASTGTIYAPNGATGIPLNSTSGVPSGWTLVNDYPPAA